jgi:hypothetical protein
VDHQASGPPWTSLHCRPDELTGAWPLGAPGHGGLPRLHGKDEELAGVRFRASPKTEEWRGDRATEESRGMSGGGWWGSSPFIVGQVGGRR